MHHKHIGFFEAAWIKQYIEPFAGGQFAGSMLAINPRSAAAKAGLIRS
jgi:hypothetical protein